MIKIPDVSKFPKKLNAAQVKVIILEGIINPIFTDNGNRSDRATSLPKYEIKKSSITGQFIASQGKAEALFDFETAKEKGEWFLSYGYAQEEIETADIATISQRLRTNDGLDSSKFTPSSDELTLIQEFIGDSDSKYGVLRDVLLANNLFDSRDLNRKSAGDLSTLFDSAVAKTVTLQSKNGHTIQGTIFDVSYKQSGIPTDNVARSKNNDFIIGKEGYVSVRAAIAVNLDDLQDVEYKVVAIG
jgi:hypothetical protein